MKAILITATVLLLVGVAARSNFAGLNVNVKDGPSASDEIPPIDVPANLGPFDEVGSDFKLVLLALLPHGFETSEMQLDAGEYIFIIGNRTGLKEINVQFDREGQARIGEAAVGGRQRNWKQRFKLTPGTYIVSANSDPEWTCRIVVK